MPNLNFEKDITALRVIDPYNDFISEGGKIWDRVKTIAAANERVPHMGQVLNAAFKATSSTTLERLWTPTPRGQRGGGRSRRAGG